MHFQKQDLLGNHYRWDEEGKKNVFVGQPTRRAFDRSHGDQVLFMINFYGSLSEQHSIEEGKMIEDRLINQLPLQMQSEIAVFNWLRASQLTETAAL